MKSFPGEFPAGELFTVNGRYASLLLLTPIVQKQAGTADCRPAQGLVIIDALNHNLSVIFVKQQNSIY